MRHNMRLKKDPFQLIWEGRKTIELRLFDEKRQLLQVGDKIEFEEMATAARRITVKITRLHRFASFTQLYAALPLEKCGYLPGEKAAPEDMLAYYSAVEQEKYGVVGIEFTVTERRGESL